MFILQKGVFKQNLTFILNVSTNFRSILDFGITALISFLYYFVNYHILILFVLWNINIIGKPYIHIIISIAEKSNRILGKWANIC